MNHPEVKPRPEWVAIVKKYSVPDNRKSTTQIITSVLPYIALWILAYQAYKISFWLALPISMINAGFLMRTFIIQHDCGHNSFFKSTKLNNFVGSILGVITLTPYFHWRKAHAIHHATAGDLDFRGIGDIDTITVEEYMEMSLWNRFKYRFYRHPLIVFVVGPVFVFVVAHRVPMKTKKGDKKEKASVWWTNAALAVLFVGLSLWIGPKAVLAVQAPITIFSSMIGVYLFYVQHQFEDTYWRRHKEWDYARAALEGSSFFKLPKVLQWFSGNIGFHHVHHLSPLIPNYNLERAHYENEIFQTAHTITLSSSFQNVFLHLWDEQRQRLISFGEYYRFYRRNKSGQTA